MSMDTASSTASLSLAKGRFSCKASHQTAGSTLFPKCPGKKSQVPVCSTLDSDRVCCLCSSFRLLCHSWNPNPNNHGMVRLPKLSASKTGSILCTYAVVLLKMLLGGRNPDTVDVEGEGFFSLLSGFWGPAALFITSFKRIFIWCDLKIVSCTGSRESSALATVSPRGEGGSSLPAESGEAAEVVNPCHCLPSSALSSVFSKATS